MVATPSSIAGSAETPTDAELHFLYVADPLCSWCYGFSPVVTAVARHFAGRVPLRIVMGGLRAGNTRPMRAEDKDYIRNAWTRVGEATGQPFDHAFFERDGFIYDTEPACRAVVAARRLAPERTLDLMAAVSRAFYAGNRDVTTTDVLVDVAAATGFDRDSYRDALLAPETRNETFRDFLVAQDAGVRGFPFLAIGSAATDFAVAANGYRPIEGLIEALEVWIAARSDTQAAVN